MEQSRLDIVLISPLPCTKKIDVNSLIGVQKGADEPMLGLITSVQTMTVAIFMSKERGVRTCNL